MMAMKREERPREAMQGGWEGGLLDLVFLHFRL